MIKVSFVHTLTITHTHTHLNEIREPKTKKQSVNTAAFRFFCASEVNTARLSLCTAQLSNVTVSLPIQ